MFALIAVAGTLAGRRVAHVGDRYLILTGMIVVGVVFCPSPCCSGCGLTGPAGQNRGLASVML